MSGLFGTGLAFGLQLKLPGISKRTSIPTAVFRMSTLTISPRTAFFTAGLLVLFLSACGTQSTVLPEYAGKSLSGGTLVVAPLQGEVEVRSQWLERKTEGSPSEAYADFLREQLPDVLAEHGAFNRTVYADYAGEPTFTSQFVEYKNAGSETERAFFKLPKENPIQFRGVEADYVLFLKDIELFAGTASGMGGIIRETGFYQESAFILWDNHAGRRIVEGGGRSRIKSENSFKEMFGASAGEEPMHRAIKTLAVDVLEGSPFEKK